MQRRKLYRPNAFNDRTIYAGAPSCVAPRAETTLLTVARMDTLSAALALGEGPYIAMGGKFILENELGVIWKGRHRWPAMAAFRTRFRAAERRSEPYITTTGNPVGSGACQ
jgi:hypothetical protein